MDQTRKKRIFGFVSLAFLMLLLYASYDIATRTTFPGSKPQLKERLEERLKRNPEPADTLKKGQESSPDSVSDSQNN